MTLIIPQIVNLFHKLPESFYRSNKRRYFGVSKLINTKHFKILKSFDNFGSARVRFAQQEFTILNDLCLDDQLVDPNFVDVVSCCILHDDGLVEYGEVGFEPYGPLTIRNFKTGTLPIAVPHQFCTGPIAYYYFDRFLSLRIDGSLITQIPRKYHHVEAAKWIYGPRIKVFLTKV